MGKKTTYENFRVEITPQTHSWMRRRDSESYANEERDSCRDIIEAVKRHVDGVRHAVTVFDTVEQCEFCGYAWSEEASGYNGGCCDKDEANNPAKQEYPDD